MKEEEYQGLPCSLKSFFFVLVVGCSTPKLHVDNKCLMAGPYTLAFIDISIAGTSSVT